MKVVIAKVDEVLFDGEAVSLTVPGVDGQMTVMGGHMPLITTLKEGLIIIRESKDSIQKTFPIHSGVMEVRHDGATVLL